MAWTANNPPHSPRSQPRELGYELGWIIALHPVFDIDVARKRILYTILVYIHKPEKYLELRLKELHQSFVTVFPSPPPTHSSTRSNSKCTPFRSAFTPPSGVPRFLHLHPPLHCPHSPVRATATPPTRPSLPPLPVSHLIVQLPPWRHHSTPRSGHPHCCTSLSPAAPPRYAPRPRHRC